MFAAPNSSSIMGSVPARQRGAASGMRSTFQNSGTALSIGVFFSLMIAGLASSLPTTLTSGLQRQGVPHASRPSDRHPAAGVVAVRRGPRREPGAAPAGGQRRAVLAPGRSQRVLTGRAFFPEPDLRAVPPRPGRSCSPWRPPCRRWPPSRRCCAAAAARLAAAVSRRDPWPGPSSTPPPGPTGGPQPRPTSIPRPGPQQSPAAGTQQGPAAGTHQHPAAGTRQHRAAGR